MYWTAHVEGGPWGDPSPIAAVGSKVYSFGWVHTATKVSETTPMQVHLLNTETLHWSKVFPTVKQDENSTYPKHRFRHSAVVYEDKIYIWGGLFKNYFEELLCFDTCTYTWRNVEVSGTIPQPRHAHFAFVVGHCMYVIGGFDRKTKKYSPDVFCLDLQNMKWEYIAASSAPYVWEGISACAVGHRIYIFGGELYRSHWNGGSFFDTVTRKWHRIVICESCPLMWKSPTFVYRNSIYVFGGIDSKPRYNSIYLLKLSADTNRWVKVHIQGMSHIPLTLYAYVVVDFQVFGFGGKCNFDRNNADLHIIDFHPTLKLLSLRVIRTYDLDLRNLPKVLKSEIMSICN